MRAKAHRVLQGLVSSSAQLQTSRVVDEIFDSSSFLRRHPTLQMLCIRDDYDPLFHVVGREHVHPPPHSWILESSLESCVGEL
jgi:hypothetical protein